MTFGIRSFLIFTVLVAFGIAGIATLERTWFGPARTGRIAQKEIQTLLAEKGWQGQVLVVHYDYAVRILLHNFDEADLPAFYPILHELPWLKRILIHSPQISASLQQEMEEEFPKCSIVVQK